jgi:hypothetical protein
MVDLLEGKPLDPEARILSSMLNWVLRFIRVLKHEKRFNNRNHIEVILKLTDFWNEGIDIIEQGLTKAPAHVRPVANQQCLHRYEA